MSLKEARQLVAYAKKHGFDAAYFHNRAACLAHNPAQHGMCGDLAVVLTWFNGPFRDDRFVWCKADIDRIKAAGFTVSA